MQRLPSSVIELLHIDDDLVEQRAVSRALREAPGPVNLTQVLTLDEGMAALGDGHFDVVLLDLELGLHRDLEALITLRARGVQIPVVVVSDDDGPRRLAAAEKAGATDVVKRSELTGANLWRIASHAVRRAAVETLAPGVTLVAARPRLPSVLAAGEQVGPYIVEGIAGYGGMSTVFRVRHHRTGARHAMKVVTPGSGSIGAARLELEATVQTTVRHPHVVPALDVVDIPEHRIGLVMEYVSGPTLYEWAQLGPRTGPERMSVMRQTALGVRSMHAMGFVHRDLKPSNVLLERGPGGRWLAKVADFGIAKIIGVEPRSGPLTVPGSVLGTPGYIAPEQIEDASGVTKRADMFSLGCLLYLLVCGRPAFIGGSGLSLMMQIRQGAYMSPRTARPGLPEPLARLIEWALVVEPSLRLPDCTTLLEGLDAVDAEALPTITINPHSRPT